MEQTLRKNIKSKNLTQGKQASESRFALNRRVIAHSKIHIHIPSWRIHKKNIRDVKLSSHVFFKLKKYKLMYKTDLSKIVGFSQTHNIGHMGSIFNFVFPKITGFFFIWTYDINKCKSIFQWVWEDYISRLQISLV